MTEVHRRGRCAARRTRRRGRAEEERRADAARGADHRRLRGDPAVRRTARPRAAAWRGPRHLRAALRRASRSAAGARRVPRRCLSRSIIKGLLAGGRAAAIGDADELDDDELLAELGVEEAASDITELRHVRTAADKRAAEEIANRQKCEDFEQFKPLFQKVQQELASGIRQTRPFELKAEIRPGSWFIVGGQKAYVAEMGEMFSNAQGRTDARLRVIFDNGTESNMLMRSLQRALHKDEAGRRITDPVAGPLFAGESEEGDLASGTSMCCGASPTIPIVAAHRECSAQDRRDRRRRRATDRQRSARPDIPHGGRGDRRDLRALQHQPDQA